MLLIIDNIIYLDIERWSIVKLVTGVGIKYND